MRFTDRLRALGDHYGLVGSIRVDLVAFPLNVHTTVYRWRLNTLDGTDLAYLPVDYEGYMSSDEAIRIAYNRIFHELR